MEMLSNAEAERIVDERTAHIQNDCERHLAQCKVWDEIIEEGWKEIHDSWEKFFEDLDALSAGAISVAEFSAGSPSSQISQGEIEEESEDLDVENTTFYATSQDFVESFGDYLEHFDMDAIFDVVAGYKLGYGFYLRPLYARNDKAFWDVLRRHDTSMPYECFDDAALVGQHCFRMHILFSTFGLARTEARAAETLRALSHLRQAAKIARC